MSDEVCSFKECMRRVRSHGLCWSHERQRAAGKSLAPIRAWRPQSERDEQGRKQCRHCQQWRAPSDFSKSTRSPDGLADLDKQCATDKHRLHLYGISLAQYDALLLKQSGGCAICGEQCSSGRRLAVDHDHACCPGMKTCGKCVRGLLCGQCNQGIGKLRDSPRLLVNAIAYLT